MSSTHKTKTVTVERLHERLYADFERGLLYYKPIGLSWWDTRYAGKECFNINCHGYLVGTLDKVRLLKHRVLVAMSIGDWPDEVDHINGLKSDNRSENLRAVTRTVNSKNLPISARNTSGVTGVTWHKNDNRWCANIHHMGKYIYLGGYKNFEDAVKVRKEAEIKYGYHQNHGRDSQRKV